MEKETSDRRNTTEVIDFNSQKGIEKSFAKSENIFACLEKAVRNLLRSTVMAKK